MIFEDEKKVGDFVELIRGTTYQGALVGKPGPALLGLGSIVPGGGFRGKDFKTYGGECPEKLMLRPGDLFVSLKGATKGGDMIGSIARVPPEVQSGRLTQDTVKLVFRTKAEPLRSYIYWLLRTPHYRDYCAGRATGSAVVALSRDDFLSYPVPPLSPLGVEVISALDQIDEKIELNRKMNATLEAMARALFRDWFVDFGPTRAKMEGRAPNLSPHLWSLFPDRLDDEGKPEGWEAGTLGAVATARNEGVDPSAINPDTPYIGLEHMPRGSIALNDWEGADKVSSNKAAFEAGDFLFGKLRPYFHKVGIAPISGICSTDIVVVRPKTAAWAGFVIACISDDDFVAYTDKTSTGTKMPRTSWTIMAKYPVMLPSKKLAEAFNATVAAMLERIRASIHESRTLAQTRDLLLPRLMSGELRLAEAERRARAVA